jgi:hypothetical protein
MLRRLERKIDELGEDFSLAIEGAAWISVIVVVVFILTTLLGFDDGHLPPYAGSL